MKTTDIRSVQEAENLPISNMSFEVNDLASSSGISRKVMIMLDYYMNGRLQIVLIDPTRDFSRVAELTFNKEDHPVQDGEFFVKTWGVNRIYASAALKTRLFKDTGRRYESQFGPVMVWTVDDVFVSTYNKHQKKLREILHEEGRIDTKRMKKILNKFENESSESEENTRDSERVLHAKRVCEVAEDLANAPIAVAIAQMSSSQTSYLRALAEPGDYAIFAANVVRPLYTLAEAIVDERERRIKAAKENVDEHKTER